MATHSDTRSRPGKDGTLQGSTAVPPFAERLHREGIELTRHGIETVQINVGKFCNQACVHCHVDAGPKRSETMDRRTAELALEFVRAANPTTVDITGGAPELHPSFRFLVTEARRDGRRVIDRCNLTVLFEPGQEDLAEFLAANGVEVIASLPCYLPENVEKQRGRGVYDTSIAALRRLNALGYGQEGSGLLLHLVYNPVGAHLPPPQARLEADYKRELATRFGIRFNRLYTITNMPIARFAHMLHREGKFDAYLALLADAFNPATLDGLMCRHLVSISWDGFVYDCDFNQMLDLRVGNGRPFRLGEQPAEQLVRLLAQQPIRTGIHCYGCTAGAGSSCGGALTT
ncbi:MAG: arsenosugar biosynthesis radical SAM protein ArsS [Candidatus Binatia bacterium]|nr:arsenosugar biosynthesis radical SAM protein ArsS [Candidatus Binatia bacterium]